MADILDYIELILRWSFFFSLIYIPARLLFMKKDSTVSRELALWFMCLSVLAVASQTLTTDGTVTGMTYSLRYVAESDYLNFTPLKIIDLIIYIENPMKKIIFAIVNTAGNVLIFAPAGFCACWVWVTSPERKEKTDGENERRVCAYKRKRTAWKLIFIGTLSGAALSLTIELLQRFLPRSTDIDDLIMNSFGAFLGALGFVAVRWIYGLTVKKRGKTAMQHEMSTGK